jgi:hypothetical protein
MAGLLIRLAVNQISAVFLMNTPISQSMTGFRCDAYQSATKIYYLGINQILLFARHMVLKSAR